MLRETLSGGVQKNGWEIFCVRPYIQLHSNVVETFVFFMTNLESSF